MKTTPKNILLSFGLAVCLLIIVLAVSFFLFFTAKFFSHRFVYYPVPDSFLEGSETPGLAERQFEPIDYCGIRWCSFMIRTRDLVAFEYPDVENKIYMARIVKVSGIGEYDAIVLKDNATTTEKIYIDWIKARD